MLQDFWHQANFPDTSDIPLEALLMCWLGTDWVFLYKDQELSQVPSLVPRPYSVFSVACTYPHPQALVSFSMLHAACNIEKLGKAWVRDYQVPSKLDFCIKPDLLCFFSKKVLKSPSELLYRYCTAILMNVAIIHLRTKKWFNWDN